MSSTYSTNLAIELMGNGDQAGNWGSTTNTNLGTLIEQAISGYVTQAVATGTDTTITIPNGATGVARNMFIELTGTGGASTNLIVPANKKLYFIYNNSTGAVTVKVSGQTGVSVPVGAKVSLVSNGTDVVTATNYMTGATFPSPTLTGVPVAPTAAVGTSTTQIATTAFVNAAIVAAYPVGSIYMSTVATNPNTLFGFGTWVTYGSGRVLISQDGTYTAGSTGGSATTTLIEANLPSHTHSATFTGTALGTHDHYVGSNDSTAGYGSDAGNREFVQNYNAGNGPATYTNPISAGTPSGSVSVGNTGSGTAFSNLPPYVAVYMWNRTA
jgi:microcystin-dependent protein